MIEIVKKGKASTLAVNLIERNQTGYTFVAYRNTGGRDDEALCILIQGEQEDTWQWAGIYKGMIRQEGVALFDRITSALQVKLSWRYRIYRFRSTKEAFEWILKECYND